VQLEQVDVVGAQSGEAAGDALLERGRAPVIPPGAFEVTAFGEEEILGSAIRDRLADERLGVAVALGGVDDVETGVERFPQQPPDDARLGALEANLRAAEAEHAHL
jgi:hypothetical protein